MSGAHNIFDTAIATMSGLVGAITGMGLIGFFIFAAILACPCIFCLIPLLASGGSGGSP